MKDMIQCFEYLQSVMKDNKNLVSKLRDTTRSLHLCQKELSMVLMKQKHQNSDRCDSAICRQLMGNLCNEKKPPVRLPTATSLKKNNTFSKRGSLAPNHSI